MRDMTAGGGDLFRGGLPGRAFDHCGEALRRPDERRSSAGFFAEAVEPERKEVVIIRFGVSGLAGQFDAGSVNELPRPFILRRVELRYGETADQRLLRIVQEVERRETRRAELGVPHAERQPLRRAPAARPDDAVFVIAEPVEFPLGVESRSRAFMTHASLYPIDSEICSAQASTSLRSSGRRSSCSREESPVMPIPATGLRRR